MKNIAMLAKKRNEEKKQETPEPEEPKSEGSSLEAAKQAAIMSHKRTTVVDDPLLKFRVNLKTDELFKLDFEHLKDVIEEIIRYLNRHQNQLT